ncbi:MAG: ChbG/HpnK family deacetylase [Bacteroidales bacterium]|nr:ChbG/HpnK family deacetylase [Bacteroidales bacterium]
MKIIINADDFGISANVNQTTLMLHRKGIVSSTSLMANGGRFNEAVNSSKECPNLGIGVHLCLDGPFNSGIDYQTIIDKDKEQFFEKEQVIQKINNNAFDHTEIFNEYCWQIEKVLDHRIKISHLDHHHHLHLYLPILKLVIKAAKKYDIPYIRSQRLTTCKPKSYMNTLYRNIHQLYLNLRLRSVGGYFDTALEDCPDFEINYNRLIRLMNKKRGIIEIVLHPVQEDDPETVFYTSQKVMELLSVQEIINYHHL